MGYNLVYHFILVFLFYMKIIILFLLFHQFIFVNAQEFETNFLRDYFLTADKFIGVDDFDNNYYVKNNTLYKKTYLHTYSYANSQFGEITSVDITNPLKVLVFYRNFNMVLLLDNKLNELSEPINFSIESFSENFAFVSMSSNNNLWLYSFDDHILQLWNHQTRKIQFKSQPVTFYVNGFEPIKQLSTYKYCWLIGEKNILKFNEYGTFLESYEVNNTDLTAFKEGFVILQDNKLYYTNSTKNLQPIIINPELFIKSFYVNTNHIYIFDGTKVFVFNFIKI